MQQSPSATSRAVCMNWCTYHGAHARDSQVRQSDCADALFRRYQGHLCVSRACSWVRRRYEVRSGLGTRRECGMTSTPDRRLHTRKGRSGKKEKRVSTRCSWIGRSEEAGNDAQGQAGCTSGTACDKSREIKLVSTIHRAEQHGETDGPLAITLRSAATPKKKNQYPAQTDHKSVHSICSLVAPRAHTNAHARLRDGRARACVRGAGGGERQRYLAL